MARLTQNTCINLAAKLADYTQNPPRMADLKAALYGLRGAVTDEISYLGRNKKKLSDAWVDKARSESSNDSKSLNEVRNTFMVSESF